MIEVCNVFKSYGSTSRVGIKELIVGKRIIKEGLFSRKWALEDISFSVDAGRSLGIVGHNGTGKSTLLSLMLGTLKADRGSVVQRGRIGAMLELGSGFHPDLTGRENVFLNASILGLRISEIRAQFDAIVDFSELGSAIEQPLRTYSAGMIARLAFAVLAHAHSDVLLIDEVLGVGDASYQKKCEDFFLRYISNGGTLVIVSHDLVTIKRLCIDGICLHKGKLIEWSSINSAVDCYKKLSTCPQQ
ncbi:MAG: ABC transporter ATP-binding protein [Desulfobacterales bacterium]|nr:ABC transporter ATP-binding protein [Desulfobacterales bacterium]